MNGARLSPEGTAQAASASVLVRRALRFRHARADPQHAACQLLFAIAAIANQRRRLGRPLFRAKAARRQGIELDPDPPEGPIRGTVPLLHPDKPLFDKTWVLADIEKVK